MYRRFKTTMLLLSRKVFRNKQLFGTLLFVANGLVSVLMIIVAKSLRVRFGVKPSILVFARFGSFFIIALPFMIRDRFGFLFASKTTTIRDILAVFAVFLWYQFGSMVDVNNSTTISFVTPVFVIILNSIFFKVKTTPALWVAIVVCFAGVLVVAGFSLKDVSFAYVMIMVMCLMRAMVAILSKSASQSNSVLRITMSNAFIGVLISGLIFVIDGESLSASITLRAIPLIVLSTLLYFLYFITYLYSAKISNLSLLQPFDFLRIVFSAILSFLLLNEKMSLTTFIGSTMIVGGVFITLYEKNIYRKLKLVIKDA